MSGAPILAPVAARFSATPPGSASILIRTKNEARTVVGGHRERSAGRWDAGTSRPWHRIAETRGTNATPRVPTRPERLSRR